MLLYYFKALLLGMIIALPFGPVGMLCLQRAMAGGVLAGLVSGLGAAFADAFYGAVAAFGLQFLSDFLTSHHELLQLGGGIFMLLLGLRLLLRPAGAGTTAGAGDESVLVQAGKSRRGGMAGAFLSSFVLAGANPMTVLAFLAFFAGFGLGGTATHYGHAAAVVLGVFSGSMVWWVAIAFGGGRLRHTAVSRMALLQRTSGAVVALFGFWALAQGLHTLWR